MTETERAEAGWLRKGDVLVCPHDGVEESVLFSRKVLVQHRHIRTARHDHTMRATRVISRRKAEG